VIGLGNGSTVNPSKDPLREPVGGHESTALFDPERIFGSPAGKRILRFFHENRCTMDTIQSHAVWTGCAPKKVASAADDLVRLELLERVGEGEDAVYLLAGSMSNNKAPTAAALRSYIQKHFRDELKL